LFIFYNELTIKGKLKLQKATLKKITTGL